ncbi:hypothetical protein B0H14DRAFT_2557153 [Mycena olivaceomarginata]|nr:hypothetical protein B0H14DRAFT_2557153 [Mycena olivaceomarginata]
MPCQPTVTKSRLNNIVVCLAPTLALKELNDAFGPPFVQPITNTIETLINMTRNVKWNKDECAQLMENIHPIVYGIINLHLRSETVESLAPVVLDHIGKFMETLHKIYTFLEAQQDGNVIKHLFRLDQAVEVFKITTGSVMLNDIGAIKQTAKLMHEELLDQIQTLSDASTSSDRSSPKIFHGRESEQASIMKMLSQQPARIAILGGGGMGKTSLARAVLHHPDTFAKFWYRFFVSAESATTSIELAGLIGLHVGLDPGKDLTRPVVQYLSQKPHSLLILDNLETVWEPIQSRGGVEEFLSLLTEITMRGAERPAKVHWTPPFLSPLQPLSDEAAQQTFMEITDNVCANEEIEQILQLTDNMPLAVDLIAHLSDYEGISSVLARWNTERTALISVGYDQKSNLDVSISLSLSSPRITDESRELLGLLSILPDGLSDAELVQSNLPIPNILSCKTVLLATSLAYQDSNRRLRSLMPVQEHVKQFLPPSPNLVQCLRKLPHELLALLQKYNGEQLGPVVNQITLNLANFQEVLQWGLYDDAPDLATTISSIASLNLFHRFTGCGVVPLIEYIQPILPGPNDHQVEIHVIIEVLQSYNSYPTLDREQLITRAINLFEHFNNPLLECVYFCEKKLDIPQSIQFFQKALQCSKLCQDSDRECHVLMSIALLKWNAGDYCTAQMHATEAQTLSHLSANVYLEAKALRIIEINSPDQNGFSYAISLLNIAHIDAICGDTTDLHHNLHQAKDIISNFVSPVGMIYFGMIEADIELREEKLDLAKVRFQEYLLSVWGTNNQIESFCLERLADIKAWSTSDWQFRWPVTYLGYAYKTKDELALHKALLCLGDVFIVNTDRKTAANLYTLALEGFTHIDVHHSRAQCMIRLGDLANEQGHTSKAISLWQTARPLFEQSLQSKDITQIDVRLLAAEKSNQKALLELTTLNEPDQLLNRGTFEIQDVESGHFEGAKEEVLSVPRPY